MSQRSNKYLFAAEIFQAKKCFIISRAQQATLYSVGAQ